MSNFIFLNDEEANGKISIDDLYERNQQRDLKQLSIFNKILNRIHRRITLAGRNKRNDKYIWFNIPEYIFGEPAFDAADCVAFVVNKLADNGFHVRYIHPNTLFISWENWVPAYVRTEIRKKTGKIINEKGQVVEVPEVDDVAPTAGKRGSAAAGGSTKPPSYEDLINGQGIFAGTIQSPQQKRTYTPIDSYRPTGLMER
jgi:hypothetical protein